MHPVGVEVCPEQTWQDLVAFLAPVGLDLLLAVLQLIPISHHHHLTDMHMHHVSVEDHPEQTWQDLVAVPATVGLDLLLAVLKLVPTSRHCHLTDMLTEALPPPVQIVL